MQLAKELAEVATQSVLEGNCEELAETEESNNKDAVEKKSISEPIYKIIEEVENGEFSTEMLDRILEGFEGMKDEEKQTRKVQSSKKKLSKKGKSSLTGK